MYISQENTLENSSYILDEQNLKPSLYNSFVLSEDKEDLIGYNFLYKSIIKIPIEIFSDHEELLMYLTKKSGYEKVNLSLIPQEWLDSLYSTKFIIDSNIDELSLIKYHYFKNLFDSQTLSLIILPTLWCNLTCPYCFEYKKPISMSHKTQEMLLDWIKINFSQKKHIHISWFGGEPLLEKDTIINLTKEIKRFCNEINATYSSSITTNGFYFDKEFQKLLPELSINNVQITLDGDKAAHDSLKKQISEEGSFDVIYKNIIDYCEQDLECKLSIRFNCTDSNYNSVKNLIDNFPESVKNKASVFFRWVWSNEASGFKEFSSRLNEKEPFKELFNIYNYSNLIGLKTENPSNDSFGVYCEVDFLDQYNIDPLGNIYLCSHTFNESEAIGSIYGGHNFINSNYISDYARWYSINPFEDCECLKCKLLPTCFGGCRKSRFEGNRNCLEEKRSISLFTKNVIAERLNQQIYAHN